eukprot:1147146-Pelagomonas_calceolata.AAC.10
MVEKVSRRRSKIEGRSFALVSTISRTKKMTSSALAVLASPRKSISRCTTLLATSGNLSAQLWMACNDMCGTGEDQLCVCPREQFEKTQTLFSLYSLHAGARSFRTSSQAAVLVLSWLSPILSLITPPSASCMRAPHSQTEGPHRQLTCTSICRYSPPFSKSLFCVFTTSFFRTMTTCRHWHGNEEGAHNALRAIRGAHTAA